MSQSWDPMPAVTSSLPTAEWETVQTDVSGASPAERPQQAPAGEEIAPALLHRTASTLKKGKKKNQGKGVSWIEPAETREREVGRISILHSLKGKMDMETNTGVDHRYARSCEQRARETF
jgi:hypothetical protein